MGTRTHYSDTLNLSYANVFQALYEGVEGPKEKLDLKTIQNLFKVGVKNRNQVTFQQVNEVELGLTFVLDSKSDFLLDATYYENKYGTQIVLLTLQDYKDKVDPENSCKFQDLFPTQNYVEKRTLYGAVAIATLAALCFAYFKNQS